MVLVLFPIILLILLQLSSQLEGTVAFAVMPKTTKANRRTGATDKKCATISSGRILARRRMHQPTPDDNDDFQEEEEEDRYHDESEESTIERRDVLMSAAVAAAAAGVAVVVAPSARPAGAVALLFENPDDAPYSPAQRPTAYRVDSTIPPTLLPVPTASAQSRVLRDLGRGRGTDKDAIAVDTINLNNMLNKAVFGTAAAVSRLVSSSGGGGPAGGGGGAALAPASFVCLGVPSQPTAADLDLGLSLLRSMAQEAARSKAKHRAVGVSVFPYSAQSALDGYVRGSASLGQLQSALESAGVSTGTLELYRPILEYAGREKLDLIAAAVEIADRQAVLSSGLQTVDPVARDRYVADPEGFIAQVNDPRFQLYTDRSLLKDAAGSGGKVGNFFSDRILAHEAAATAAARYAASHPGALVFLLAPVADVRYLNGLNGRIPRIYQKLTTPQRSDGSGDEQAATSSSSSSSSSTVTANDVTTILLNPNPADTLSKTRRLRLEIGTGPDTLPYQTKVADYLWFSASPSVSLLPRLMDY